MLGGDIVSRHKGERAHANGCGSVVPISTHFMRVLVSFAFGACEKLHTIPRTNPLMSSGSNNRVKKIAGGLITC